MEQNRKNYPKKKASSWQNIAISSKNQPLTARISKTRSIGISSAMLALYAIAQ